MNIPLYNVAVSDRPYREEIDGAIKDCIDNNDFILGKSVEGFEEKFAEYIGVKYCIGVSNCTNALFLTLKSLGIKIGDKVLCPVMTVTADVEAILMCGATPLFYDDKALIEADRKVKAIIIVHLYGNDRLYDNVHRYATARKWHIIEDCAQSAGTISKARHLGTRGVAGCFSFNPTKILGGYGDGGAVVTNNERLYSEIKTLRNHGRLPGQKTVHHYVGYNYRLDGLQAAILNVKLKHLDMYIGSRRVLAFRYNELLKDFPLETPVINPGTIFCVYVIKTENRDELKEYLKDCGIGTGEHYPIPLHRQPPYKKFVSRRFMDADNDARRILSLPFYPGITNEQVDYIVDKIREFYGG